MATKKQATAGVTPKKVRATSVRRKVPEQLTLSGLGEYSRKGLTAAGAWPPPNPAKPAFDPTKPVETRDGRKARVLCTDAKQDGLGPILALVSQDDGFESPMFFFADGKFDASRAECGVDLVNAPVREEVPGAVRFVDSNGNARKFHVTVHLTNNQLVSIEPGKEAL